MQRSDFDTYGSHLVSGPKYSVLECRGPVRHRQSLASAQNVSCYIEAHLNASSDPLTKQHGFCITGKSASAGTLNLSRAILRRIEAVLGVRDAGLIKGGRGSGNVCWVAWPTPALLLEPLFISDPKMMQMLASGGGVLDVLAACVVNAVVECFPDGALVGVSKGHLYRGRADVGALAAHFDVDGDGDTDLDPAFDTEGELVEIYVDSFTDQLVGLS